MSIDSQQLGYPAYPGVPYIGNQYMIVRATAERGRTTGRSVWSEGERVDATNSLAARYTLTDKPLVDSYPGRPMQGAHSGCSTTFDIHCYGPERNT